MGFSSHCVDQIPSGFLPWPQHRKISLQNHLYTRLILPMGLQPLQCLMQDPTEGCCVRRKEQEPFRSLQGGKAPTEAQPCPVSPQNQGLCFLPHRRLFFCRKRALYSTQQPRGCPVQSCNGVSEMGCFATEQDPWQKCNLWQLSVI